MMIMPPGLMKVAIQFVINALNKKKERKIMKNKIEWIECEKCDGTGHDIFMEFDGIICNYCKGTGEENEE